MLEQHRRSSGEVSLAAPATHQDRLIIERLYPLYLRELSAHTDYYRLDQHGRWQPDHLGEWLAGGLLHPLLIRDGDKPVGFSFVAEAPWPHVVAECDFQICEFFVAHPYRRRGIGTRAAIMTLDRFHGRWAVSELIANRAAQAFWRRVIHDYTGGRYNESRDGEDVTQRFENRGRALGQ